MGARDQLRTVPGLSPEPKSGEGGGQMAACSGAASSPHKLVTSMARTAPFPLCVAVNIHSSYAM